MNTNFSKNQINQILKMAGEKMGKTPDNLKKDVQQGNIEKALNNLNPTQAEKIKQILNNPVLANQMLNTPQARSLIEKFSKGK